MNPELSVIIPVYNKAPFLRRCFDSCVKQQGNVEFVVVDDGSTDGSSKICDEYASMPRFRVFRKQNGGVSSARNFGIEQAKGKYITFLDADDEYPKEATITMLKYKAGKITSFNHLRQTGATPKLKKYVSTGVYDFYERQLCWWGVWNKVYETSFIKDNHIRFDEKVNFGEDELFNLECLLIAKHYKHNALITLIRHFDDKQSLVHAISPKEILEQYDGLRRVEKQLIESGASKKDIGVPRALIKEHNESGLYLRVLEGKTPEEYKKWKNLT